MEDDGLGVPGMSEILINLLWKLTLNLQSRIQDSQKTKYTIETLFSFNNIFGVWNVTEISSTINVPIKIFRLAATV